MDKILITGAGGFIGRGLAGRLKTRGYDLRGVFRRRPEEFSRTALKRFDAEDVFSKKYTVTDIGREAIPEEAFKGVDVLVHLAGRAHILNDTLNDPLAEYRRVNTFATEHLARKAARLGVRRFIYVSTLKVNGENSDAGAISESSPALPEDPYSVSKWEAETLLRDIARQTDLEVVILRPPLVYGPGVKGNFLRLLNIVYRQIPLPLGGIVNKRSMIALENMIDILSLCLWHPKASGKVYLLSDGEDMSTPDLIRMIAGKMGKKIILPKVPRAILKGCLKMIGKEDDARRILGTLIVDAAKIREELGWVPPVSLEEQLDSTVKWYLNGCAHGDRKR